MIQLKVFSGAGSQPFNAKIYTPDNTTGNLPAFVFFTGKGESGMDVSLIDRNGPFYWITNKGWKPNFIVICVQVNQNQAPGPLALVQAALTNLADPIYRIDWNKWYLTGLSYGAATLIGYIQGQTDTLFRKPAAIMPMSINMSPMAGSRYDAQYTIGGTDIRFKSIPSWGFCGTADSFYETMHKFWLALAKAGGTTKWTEDNIGHGPWNQWYDPATGIYDWALQYSNSATANPPVVVPPPVVIPPPPPIVVPPAKTTIFSISLIDSKKFTLFNDGSYSLQ